MVHRASPASWRPATGLIVVSWESDGTDERRSGSGNAFWMPACTQIDVCLKEGSCFITLG